MNVALRPSREELRLRGELRRLSVGRHLLGYDYITEAVFRTCNFYNEPRAGVYKSITEDIYPLVASYYLTSVSRVRCAIRRAISLAYTLDTEPGGSGSFERVFGHNRCPADGEFLSVLALRLMRRF